MRSLWSLKRPELKPCCNFRRISPEMRWLALSPHSKTVWGLTTSWTKGFSVWSSYFGFSPQPKKNHPCFHSCQMKAAELMIPGGVRVNEVCALCDGLEACPCCIPCLHSMWAWICSSRPCKAVKVMNGWMIWNDECFLEEGGISLYPRGRTQKREVLLYIK